MSTPKILIVEDEPKLANILVDYFAQAQFQSHCIFRGDEVEPWLENNHADAIALDLMLPGKDGLQICQDIRKSSNIPILMMTARVEEIDRLLGLELGADDYICKPYSPRELVARVKAVLRRAQPENQPTTLPFLLDKHRLKVVINKKDAELTGIEFGILELLAVEPGRIFSRDQLMSNIYQDHRIVSDRTIDSHVKKLRKKLAVISDTDFIHSVYGVGYRLLLSP